MTFPAAAGRFWQTARRLPSHTSLRMKLITAVLALVAIALTVSGLVGLSVLRSYLLGQADAQLQNLYSPDSGQPDFGFGGHGASIAGPNGTGPQFYVYEALTAQGKLVQLRGTYLAGHPGPSVTPGASWLTSSTGSFVTVPAQSGSARWRVVAYPDETFVNSATGTHFGGTLIVGLDVTDVYATVGQLTSVDLIVSVLVILALAVVGFAVVQASLRPLTDIERTAEGIAAGDLARRVPDRDPRTEVGRLGRSLNAMLAQIQTAFEARAWSEYAARRSEERMRQFVTDASHELRTPLTTIRGFAEYYRQRGGVADATALKPADPADATALKPADPADATALKPADPADDAATIPAAGQLSHADLDRLILRVEQEATRMGVLVDDMLLLARLDQQRPIEFRTVDLLAIAADALHDARVVAPQRTINLTVGTPDAPLVLGDEVRLRQVVGNLMSNAMTHTPDGTPIEITIRSGTLGDGLDPAATAAATAVASAVATASTWPPGWQTEPAVILEVADSGPGLTDEQQEHVFERFYRADRARSRTAGGTGLGLAIVAALVSAHYGRVWVNSKPGDGATFGFALPLAPEARAA
jgi:two-component system OmpR family sensor kinase